MTDLSKGVIQSSAQERPLFVLMPTETVYRLTYNDLIKLIAEKIGENPVNVVVCLSNPNKDNDYVVEATVRHNTGIK